MATDITFVDTTFCDKTAIITIHISGLPPIEITRKEFKEIKHLLLLKKECKRDSGTVSKLYTYPAEIK